MSLWRVRITMSSDPRSQELLTAALAKQRVWALLPPSEDSGETGEVIIELPRDESFGALLSDLHMISPRVFVSSVTEAQLPVRARSEQARDEGLAEPALIAVGRPAPLGYQSPV